MTIPVPEQRLAAADAAPVAHHRTTRVDGVNIFYRKAGPVDAPAVLLMHGFPTSSHMFRNLIAALANLYHVMAPDYPGYGQSEAPDRSKFAYTFQYTDGVADVSRVSPDNWVHDQALLDRPGNADIQLDLFYDYRTNLPLYPAVKAYFRAHRPPTLIVWSKNDKIFPADGAHPYKRDLPDVEFHLIDTGHFALEDKADEMVPLIRDFLKRKVARQ